jgi:phenylpropionate dioxygenase-like ring-hydroxylating dioxygenase large terminal subunit
MLTREDNQLLCSVGPGTPGGELHRHYWQPIAPVAELQKTPIKKIRILSEDLVLFRDLQGRYGLVDQRCPHRNVSLEFGIPDREGLRCSYHGWLFNQAGRCLDTPLEPEGTNLPSKVCIKSYPVEELGGLLWAYLGKKPAPLLPRWDIFAWPRGARQIGTCVVKCNWLQIQENALDQRHNEFLHGHYFKYILEQQGQWRNQSRPMLEMNNKLDNYRSERHDYGFTQYFELYHFPLRLAQRRKRSALRSSMAGSNGRYDDVPHRVPALCSSAWFLPSGTGHRAALRNSPN